MKGRGLANTRLKRSGRLQRAISRTSRNPFVVSRAVFAPLRSVSALMIVVVPWMNASTPLGSTPLFSMTWMTPSSKLGGVVWLLAR